MVQNADQSWTVTDLRSGTPDGTDTLKNIENLKFSDKTVLIGTTTTPPTNTAPVASNDSYSTSAGTALTVTAPSGLLANDHDADGNHLTASLVTSPGPRAPSSSRTPTARSPTRRPGASPARSASPMPNSDGTAKSNSATVTITVGQTQAAAKGRGADAGRRHERDDQAPAPLSLVTSGEHHQAMDALIHNLLHTGLPGGAGAGVGETSSHALELALSQLSQSIQSNGALHYVPHDADIDLTGVPDFLAEARYEFHLAA